eukprot:g22555.t1
MASNRIFEGDELFQRRRNGQDGSTSLPAYGFDVLVVDDHGRPTTANTPGSLLVRLPLPPGTFPTLWKNDAGFVKSYMETYPGYFYTGDAGVIDQDGYVTVLERNDDIINVAAHRLSCGQIEAAIKAHPDVNDCAVVGAADPIKGQVPLALLVLNDGLSKDPEDIVKEVKEKVRHDIGAIASLAGATVVEQLPKTRSGKVLRKNIRGMADGKLPPIPGTIEKLGRANLRQVPTHVETDLTFVALVGMIDPPRPECMQAIRECRVAGITIARKLGILTGTGNVQKSFTGKEFEMLSDADKIKVLQRIVAERDIEGAVFSRTEPKHKQTTLRQNVMGLTGTEVAKEASDMVLADDHFATIVSAVEEGRSIYNNMKAFIRYLISSNIGEVASIFFTAALGIPEGLAPVQLLWVNLVTDGLPATALSFNPPDLDVMSKAPRRNDDNLISGWVFFRYMVIGLYVGVATVGIFIYWYCFDESPDGFLAPCLGLKFEDPCTYFTLGKVKASTLSLTVLVIIEMLNAFNAISEDRCRLVRTRLAAKCLATGWLTATDGTLGEPLAGGCMHGFCRGALRHPVHASSGEGLCSVPTGLA